MAAFLRSHGFVLVNAFNEEMDMNYANAVIYMVLCYGLIGGVVFVNYLTKTFKQYNCKVNAGYFVILLGILFSDQVLFNMNFLYPLSFVILLSKNETICVNEKLILSYDYELFFGDKSGTVQKTLIEPTKHLLDSFRKTHLRANFSLTI